MRPCSCRSKKFLLALNGKSCFKFVYKTRKPQMYFKAFCQHEDVALNAALVESNAAYNPVGTTGSL